MIISDNIKERNRYISGISHNIVAEYGFDGDTTLNRKKYSEEVVNFETIVHDVCHMIILGIEKQVYARRTNEDAPLRVLNTLDAIVGQTLYPMTLMRLTVNSKLFKHEIMTFCVESLVLKRFKISEIKETDWIKSIRDSFREQAEELNVKDINFRKTLNSVSVANTKTIHEYADRAETWLKKHKV